MSRQPHGEQGCDCKDYSFMGDCAHIRPDARTNNHSCDSHKLKTYYDPKYDTQGLVQEILKILDHRFLQSLGGYDREGIRKDLQALLSKV